MVGLEGVDWLVELELEFETIIVVELVIIVVSPTVA